MFRRAELIGKKKQPGEIGESRQEAVNVQLNHRLRGGWSVAV